MKLSRVKNRVLASSKRIGIEVQTRLERGEVKVCRRAKVLGVGVAVAVKRIAAATAARYVAFAQRRGQFGKLRKAGVSIAHVLRIGDLVVAQFGQDVMGIVGHPLM